MSRPAKLTIIRLPIVHLLPAPPHRHVILWRLICGAVPGRSFVYIGSKLAYVPAASCYLYCELDSLLPFAAARAENLTGGEVDSGTLNFGSMDAQNNLFFSKGEQQASTPGSSAVSASCGSTSEPANKKTRTAGERQVRSGTTSMLAPWARTALALLLLNQLRARNRSLPCFRNILCHRLCRALTCPPSVLQPGSEIAPPSSRQLLAFQNSISHHNSLFPAQVRLLSRFVGGILTMRSPARLILKKRSVSQRLRSRAMVKTLIANSRQPR